MATSEYFQDLSNFLNIDKNKIANLADLILECSKNNKSIWIFGNGGSASTAEHLETDLSFVRHEIKTLKIRASALTSNAALITAIANDIGFENIFSHQLQRKAIKGDLCIVISASGKSLNLINAVKIAKQRGLRTIGLLGFDGGELAKQVDFSIIVETEIGKYGPVEDVHLAICHAISQNLLTKNILVTGSLGYVGTHITSDLTLKNYNVFGIDSGFYKKCNLVPVFTQVPTKLKDIRDLEISDFKNIDAVIHLAALSNDPIGELEESLTYDINYKAAVRTAELAKAAKVKRFIFISTQSMYGIANSNSDLDEDNSIKNPQTAYAKSKYLAEIEILAMSGDHFITTSLRPSTVFGWGVRLRSDIIFNNLLLNGLVHKRIDVHSDGTPWRPIVHVNDLIEAIEICLKISPELISGNPFNIGVLNGNFTVRQLAEAAQLALNGVPIIFNTENIIDPRSYKVSFLKAKKVLNFQAKTDLKTGGGELIIQTRKLLEQGAYLLDRKTNRLAQMKFLIKEGLLDETLRFRF
jgi:nucleoside-diphosphate-sugar epimerase/phosphoheptose isomerase